MSLFKRWLFWWFRAIAKEHFRNSAISRHRKKSPSEKWHFLDSAQSKRTYAKVIISSVANFHFVVKTFPNCVKPMSVKALSWLCHSMRAWFLRLRTHTGKSATGLCWQCFPSVLNWCRNFSGPLSLCSRDITGPALVIVVIVVWRRLISLHRFQIVRVLFTQAYYENPLRNDMNSQG